MEISEGHTEGHDDDEEEEEVGTAGPRPEAPPHVDAAVDHLQHSRDSMVSVATATTAEWAEPTST